MGSLWFVDSFSNSKNVGQTRTLIQLIQERSVIQSLSSEQMREKFARYNLELEEVLIGTPGSSHGDSKIEQILTQLRAADCRGAGRDLQPPGESGSQRARAT